ncbi:MAG: nucleoside 2-deoxyribosyltransferase [Pseudomonadota bacterium]
MFGQQRIYLAGPEVFRLDGEIEGYKLKALCMAHGLTGVFPLDEPESSSLGIYQACIAGLQTCDAVVANISPFRGPHMDPGTAFEIGYAVGLGKPVFGWTTHPADMHERIPHLFDEPAELRIDEGHMIVEDHGHPENLMITVPLASLHGTAEAAIAAAAAALKRRR